MTNVYEVAEMSHDDLHKLCDVLMDELVRLEQLDRTVRDATVSGDVENRRIDIDLEADGTTLDRAIATAHDRGATAVAELTVPLALRELHVEVVPERPR